jgi:uncharacterized protein YndB with AHSA1/START domain
VSKTSVSVKRLLPADVGRVFEAWSSAEAMSRWFVVDPGWTVKATNDFRVGGKYRVEMRQNDGTVFLALGEYVEIAPPRKLVFTWGSALPVIERSLVTIELRQVGSGTELTLTHENLPDTDEGRAHSVGWEGTLSSLERYLLIVGT